MTFARALGFCTGVRYAFVVETWHTSYNNLVAHRVQLQFERTQDKSDYHRIASRWNTAWPNNLSVNQQDISK